LVNLVSLVVEWSLDGVGDLLKIFWPDVVGNGQAQSDSQDGDQADRLD
jgi:hypothetical protein